MDRMNSKKLRLVPILLVCFASTTLSVAEGRSTGWTVVTHSGEEVEVCIGDSLGSEALFLANGERTGFLALDSIDLLVHRASGEPSLRTHIITLGVAALGVGVFMNNAPEQSDLTMSSGLVYGLEFGGAMLLGAAVGYGIGYLIDRSLEVEQRITLTRATRPEKGNVIRSILSGAAP